MTQTWELFRQHRQSHHATQGRFLALLLMLLVTASFLLLEWW